MMSTVSVTCAFCGAAITKRRSEVNRANKAGRLLFCGRVCSGMNRRVEKDAATKKAEKAAYDRQYREKNLALLKEKKAAWFKATYDPVKAAQERKARMARHVEYCRRPEYREKKKEYDRRHRAKEYGEFAEAYMATMDVYREVNARMPRTELYATKGTQNKTLNRRRDYERLVRNHA